MTDEPRRRFQVFVSSTYNDLKEIRLQVIQQLFKINCIPVGMEMFPATNATSWELITEMIDDSDYVVVVLAQQYGTLDSSGISYTQKEFEYASISNKNVLVFPQELTPTEEAALEAPMKAFRAKIGGRNFRSWKTTAELPGLIAASLTFAMGSQNRPEGWIRSGYAMSEHVRRIHELTETMNTRIDAILSLATEQRRGTRAMSHYMRIQQLKLDLAKKNPMFAPVADGLMEDPFKTLSNLAVGHASVPSYQIGHANQLLIGAITSRFDAVSHDDLRFWGSKDQTDKAYRYAIYEATRRPVNPIIATRIFSLPLNVIVERRDELLSALSEQMREGMHWAVAVEEDEVEHRPHGSKPDFALFDHKRAVSYFRHARRFEVTFNTDGRVQDGEESEIDLQNQAYRALLMHCWLATAGFAANHLATSEEPSLLARITGRTSALKKLKFENAERLFPLIVESEDEIRGAIDAMLDLRTKVLARR